MPLRSMTGYGRADGEGSGWSCRVELRSVNHRGLDIRVAGRAATGPVEALIRTMLKEQCGRGRVECRITATAPQNDDCSPEFLDAAQLLFNRLEEVRAKLSLSTPLTVSDLIAAGLGRTINEEGEAKEPPLELVREVTCQALEALLEARALEGAVLVEDFSQRLHHIGEVIDTIEQLIKNDTETYGARLSSRVTELLRGLGNAGYIDQARLLQEIAIYIDKSDITEEIVRARSHTAQLHVLIEETAPSNNVVGKRLDFFLQELIRETNTMASKSQSASLTALVVEAKTEIERLREQVHNIE